MFVSHLNFSFFILYYYLIIIQYHMLREYLVQLLFKKCLLMIKLNFQNIMITNEWGIKLMSYLCFLLYFKKIFIKFYILFNFSLM